MNLVDPEPGYPFAGDYPDPNSDSGPDSSSDPDSDYGPSRGRLQEVLREQVDELAARRRNPRRRHRIIRKVMDGRRAYREKYRLSHGFYPVDVVELDCLPSNEDSDILFVRGEIITSRACYDDEVLRELVAGFKRSDQPVRRPSNVVRLVNPDYNARKLLATIKRLRARGCDASLNYVTLMANDPDGDPDDDDPGQTAVGKGIGTPVLVPGLQSFLAYAPTYPPASRDIVVALIDGGIPQWLRTDAWLTNIPRTGGNIDVLDVLPPDHVLDQAAGHGCAIAGVVARVAPWATIRMYRTAATDGVSANTDVAAAMIQAAEDGAHIINLSLGCQSVDDSAPVVLAEAIREIEVRFPDVVIVAAAGNYGTDRRTFPAAIPPVVAVAGVTSQLQGTDWSSRGNWVRCATGGEGILSTYVTIEYLAGPPLSEPEPWGRFSGTSFAAPQIAGAVARICYENPRLTPKAALAQLLQVATPVTDFGQALQVLPGVP